MQSRWMGARLLLALAVVGGMRAATNDRCNDLLRQALENKNPDTRKQAVVALSLAATDEPVFAKLQGMLQDKDVEVRLAAVASLAEVDTASARAARGVAGRGGAGLRKAARDATGQGRRGAPGGRGQPGRGGHSQRAGGAAQGARRRCAGGELCGGKGALDVA